MHRCNWFVSVVCQRSASVRTRANPEDRMTINNNNSNNNDNLSTWVLLFFLIVFYSRTCTIVEWLTSLRTRTAAGRGGVDEGHNTKRDLFFKGLYCRRLRTVSDFDVFDTRLDLSLLTTGQAVIIVTTADRPACTPHPPPNANNGRRCVKTQSFCGRLGPSAVTIDTRIAFCRAGSRRPGRLPSQ